MAMLPIVSVLRKSRREFCDLIFMVPIECHGSEPGGSGPAEFDRPKFQIRFGWECLNQVESFATGVTGLTCCCLICWELKARPPYEDEHGYVDSLNRHMLPPYGGDWVYAPNFKRLADRTVVFDRSYVCSMPARPTSIFVEGTRWIFH
jgi:hypothetical protein